MSDNKESKEGKEENKRVREVVVENKGNKEDKEENKEEDKEDEKLGYDTLVLSGGATKGLSIMGAVQCAIDNKLINNVTTYVGTSVGSMLGYLFCIGYTPVEIAVYICTHQLLERLLQFNLINMTDGLGAITYTPIQETLEKMTLDKIGQFLTMKELYDKFGKKLVCSTFNRTTYRMEYINYETHPNLPCLIAIRMSCNIPMLFGKFKYMGHEYVDGGIGDNFPLSAGEKLGNNVLGIGLAFNKQESENPGFVEDLISLLYIPVNQCTVLQIERMSSEKVTIVSIPCANHKFFDFNLSSAEKLNMFSEGYQVMKKNLVQ